MAQVYFYDLTTRREIEDCPFNGKVWLGTSAMVRDASGKFIEGTCTSVEIGMTPRPRSMKEVKVVTLADFPGRDAVAVKVWFPKGVEWRKLVAAPEVFEPMRNARGEIVDPVFNGEVA
jgi:hypothetical protein